MTDGGNQRVSARVGSLTMRRILVVDDDIDSADSMQKLLSMYGDYVRVAYDGEEAFNAAKDLKPDALFIDISIPRIDGNELAERIRDESWGKEAVLVALTGWSDDDDKRRSREAGFDHYFVKPAQMDEIREVIDAIDTRS